MAPSDEDDCDYYDYYAVQYVDASSSTCTTHSYSVFITRHSIPGTRYLLAANCHHHQENECFDWDSLSEIYTWQLRSNIEKYADRYSYGAWLGRSMQFPEFQNATLTLWPHLFFEFEKEKSHCFIPLHTQSTSCFLTYIISMHFALSSQYSA